MHSSWSTNARVTGASRGIGPDMGHALATHRCVALTVAVLAVPSVPLAAQSDSLPPGVSLEMVREGAEIFAGAGNCWSCHGEDAKGSHGIGPDLTDGEWWHSDGSYEAIIRQILGGVPTARVRNRFKARMPPRGGSDITLRQVRAVAAYVWSLRNGAP